MKRTVRWCVSLGICLLAMSCAASAATLASSKTPLNDSSSAKIHNIELATAALDGTTVGLDEYFSFNDTVGPRTSSYGYKAAPNGRGVKVTGGGVAQVASTLYLALKKIDGIEYEERKTYGSKFKDDYVTSSKNAILVDYKSGTDFSFYNCAQAFTVDMWVTDDYVCCTLETAYGESQSGTGDGEGHASIYLNGTSALENNVTLAADSIYDASLEQGDVFSFNDIVGPRTQRYGFKNAVNGRGVKVVGGGVGQVASVVYMAVRDLDTVTILDKHTYGARYNQDYVDDPEDAIAVDYKNDLDFSFRYTGYNTLYIYTYVDDDYIYCDAIEY